MARVNLTASDKNQQLLLDYLEQNASDELAGKINGGKRTLSDCWGFIRNKAKRQASGGCAVISDEEVFGWAVHYFEESKEDLDREDAEEQSIIQRRNEALAKKREEEARQMEAERKRKYQEALEKQAAEAEAKERERKAKEAEKAAAAAKKAAEAEEKRKKKELEQTGAVAGQTSLFDFFSLEE